ncbi:MAG: hypothetical protein ACLFVD_04950 [Dehalococcoidia bacterium]
MMTTALVCAGRWADIAQRSDASAGIDATKIIEEALGIVATESPRTNDEWLITNCRPLSPFRL